MMRFRRAVIAVARFFLDWRTGLTLAASLFVAILLVVVVLGARIAIDALEARDNTASSATRRIDQLNDRIEELGSQLTLQASVNGVRLGELSEQVAALQEQVRQLGGEPVVVDDPRQQVTTSTTTAAPPPPPTTTTTAPPPEDDCRVVEVLGRCLIGGRQ